MKSIRKKNCHVFLLCFMILLLFSGCSQPANNQGSQGANSVPLSYPEKSEDTMIVYLAINNVTIEATFYDNETAQAFISLLPLTVTMSDLNGNEKYSHLNERLPVSSTEQPDTICAGEIMYWSSNTLVLFYETFSNSYGGYVKLGMINDVEQLEEILGSGSVTITFSLEE